MKIEQLRQLRQQRQLTQKAVANAINVSLVSYNNWERGAKSPSAENLEKLAQFFDVPLDQFQGRERGESELIQHYQQLSRFRKKKVVKFAEEQVKEQHESIVSIQNTRAYNTVKVYEGLSAGTGFGIIGDGNFDTVMTDEELPSYDIAAWIRGDSMEPKFLDWSVALIRETGFDYDGAIYAVYVEESNRTYIKKVYVEKDGLRLESLNKKYPDRFVSLDDHPIIIGKIVGNFIPVTD
ncbi:XRE family transcriptional regulator [Lactococcus fujiensis]|uniref:Phage repressor-like protein n=2 Tax=Lactococcus fujiensis TaxID=610251 RepID=A0A2A5RNE1_9LACT|nr:S24 family peptidase [Lactococcus fujiensis]PCS00867.1 phage repressor-like protein [Lactococcus fujiensis JCM 16395]